MSGTESTARPGPARILCLGDPQVEDLSASTTVAERLAMVGLLSRRMWELTGRPIPVYAREEMPTRVVRSR
jgi:hypothetical protein